MTMTKFKKYDTKHGGKNVSRRISFTPGVRLRSRQLKLMLQMVYGEVTRIPDWYARWLDFALQDSDEVELVRCGPRDERELIFIPNPMYKKIKRFTNQANRNRDKAEHPTPFTLEDIITSLTAHGLKLDREYADMEIGG